MGKVCLMCKLELEQSEERQITYPTEAERATALSYFLRREQQTAYTKEYKILKEIRDDPENRLKLPENSKLSSLYPFMDENGLMRVGGRIASAECLYDMKHPVIIPQNTRMRELIIREAHDATLHGAVQVMMRFIRNRYLIPRLRNALRQFVHKCVVCARYNKVFETQLMADLPQSRVHQNRPFAAAGVDYAGPIWISEKYGRKTKKSKGWIAIFVCLITRAIHIDVVVDLSSAAFISCYERFVCRRGMCYRLYSDNGTAFVGANKELREAFKAWKVPSILSHLNAKGTSWIFMKPAAPHQGGIYEAAVKSTN